MGLSLEAVGEVDRVGEVHRARSDEVPQEGEQEPVLVGIADLALS